jgi:transcriptional regulator with XRE-family HTH domain
MDHNIDVSYDEQAIVAKNVTRLRLHRSWTKRELGRVAAVSEEVIALIENGKSVRDSSLSKVAKALGVEIEHLFLPAVESEYGQATQDIEEWETNIQTVNRYLRSITDPERRLRETRRLLALAEVAVREFEDDVNKQRAATKAGIAHAPKPSGSQASGGRG